MSDQRPAFELLGERLQEAAARELESAPPARARRRPRRLVVLAAAGLLVAGGVAGAAELIGVGEPAPRPEQPERFAPGTEGGRVAVRLADPAGGLPWAVVTYRSQGGRDCALPGRLRGSQLGTVIDGVFRPLPSNSVGGCADLDTRPFFAVTFQPPEETAHTLVFGRARAGIGRVVSEVDGERQSVAPGPDGAFLFVYAGHISQSEVSVTTTPS